jgi:hypothetical protein
MKTFDKYLEEYQHLAAVASTFSQRFFQLYIVKKREIKCTEIPGTLIIVTQKIFSKVKVKRSFYLVFGGYRTFLRLLKCALD